MSSVIVQVYEINQASSIPVVGSAIGASPDGFFVSSASVTSNIPFNEVVTYAANPVFSEVRMVILSKSAIVRAAL